MHLNDFDEFWKRYAIGRGSDKVILNSRFQDKNYIILYDLYNTHHASKSVNSYEGKEKLMFKITPEDWNPSKSPLDVIEEYFYGDWRSGQEVHKVVITQRLYQISPNSAQA